MKRGVYYHCQQHQVDKTIICMSQQEDIPELISRIKYHILKIKIDQSGAFIKV